MYYRVSLAVLSLLSIPALAAERSDVPYCQYLDRADEPAWHVLGSAIGSADVQGDKGRAFSVLEVAGGGGLLYADVPSGSVGLGGAYEVYAFEGNGGIRLPDAVADLHLEAGYQWRHWDGRSLQLTARPGFYGEVGAWESSALRVPFEVLGLQVLGPRLSGQLGVALYPGFTRAFDPRFGLRYAISDTWTADVGYPESRLAWASREGWAAYALVRNDPINEFWLEDDDARRTFRFEETRAVAGLVAPLAGVLRLHAELGYVFQRSVDFSRSEPNRSVEEALMVGLGLSGAL